MERLTEERSAVYDLKALKGECCRDYCENQSVTTCLDCAIYRAIQKLAYYEDLEEKLEKTYGECEGLLKEIVDALSKTSNPYIGKPKKSVILTDGDAEMWDVWVNAFKQGKLMMLQIKHGDLVYFIKSNFSFAEKPIQGRIFSVNILSDGTIIYKAITPRIDRTFSSYDIGKTVFLTEQEAKEALEGMKNG